MDWRLNAAKIYRAMASYIEEALSHGLAPYLPELRDCRHRSPSVAILADALLPRPEKDRRHARRTLRRYACVSDLMLLGRAESIQNRRVRRESYFQLILVPEVFVVP